MTRARALMAAVPQRVWMAVASLVVLASVGVSLVLGAGLSTWRGEVGHSAAPGLPRQGSTVVPPPRSSVIVVPTPPGHHPAATGNTATTPVPAHVTNVVPPALPHTSAGSAAAPAAVPPAPVAHPRVVRPTGSSSSGKSCVTPVPARHGRGHAYGLYKKAARALAAQGCGPLTRAKPGHGKSAAHAQNGRGNG